MRYDQGCLNPSAFLDSQFTSTKFFQSRETQKDTSTNTAQSSAVQWNSLRCWKYSTLSNKVVTGPHVALELLRCSQCDWGTGFLILFNFNECTFYTTILDSAALENQSDKLHQGSSCPSSGFTEKTITCPFILCSQISAPLT